MRGNSSESFCYFTEGRNFFVLKGLSKILGKFCEEKIGAFGSLNVEFYYPRERTFGYFISYMNFNEN
jgi:hypothetical protein